MHPKLPALLLPILLAPALLAQSHPRDSEIHDADTRAWWHTTETLSNDSMEGRDTGSAAYQRAADIVAARMKAAGLHPAGENDTFLQNVPMHEIALDPAKTSFTLDRPGGKAQLEFLREITLPAAHYAHPTTTAGLVFRGYCNPSDLAGVTGKFVVCYNARANGMPTPAERTAAVRAAGAAGILDVDDKGFTVEPPRWPEAYARSITLATAPPAAPESFLTLRLSTAAFARVAAAPGQDPGAILLAGVSRQPLPSFDIPGTLTVKLATEERDLHSPNLIGTLPGSDPTLRDQYIVVSAHLDGYGHGTPVGTDGLYNGTLDDSAYVALLLQLADDIKAGTLPAPKRSLLVLVVTGEEKGLLGSHWFVAHPTIPLSQLAANINLDQLRPLFPLRILTAPGVGLTTLGKTATEVGKSLGIEIRDDREPERNLLRRSDNWPFMQAGVPAIGFIFGFDPGTDEERRYRLWYETRYHKPADDLTQPMDFTAAQHFDTFFYNLVEALTNDPTRPRILATIH